MKLVDLLSLHIKDVLERIDAKKLAPKTRFDYQHLSELAEAAGVLETDCDILGPAHFLRIMHVLEDRQYSLRTQRNIVTSFKSMFNWAGPEGMNLIVGVVYGPRFRGPSRRGIEAQQEKDSPNRFIEREQIIEILENASPGMRVAILLGINCGFYPSDTLAVKLGHFHLGRSFPYHDFRRVKTLQQRRAIIWPETEQAIKYYVGQFSARRGVRPQQLLLNRYGEPYSAHSSGLQLSFRSLAKRAGLPSGVGVGSLRHTFATIVDSVPDQSMIDLVMGHTNSSIQKRVYKQLNVREFERLSTLANVVHDWLFD